MIKLRPTSIRWAIKHLQKEGDTDLFPRPFEIDVMSKYKADIENYISNSVDIGSYKWVGGRRAIIPKEPLSFRAITQLDPFDSLILAAIIRQYGFKIEKKRIPINEEIIFSYRFEPTSSGRMYSQKINWPLFWEKSIEKARNVGGWVLLTDISDYYNQIYHHSLENQLQIAGIPSEVVKSIIKLLGELTQKVSRGIPIGPHSVHLLAECVLNPIDRSIISRGYTFCRFVDDMHIFCKEFSEAQIALNDLVSILDSVRPH